MYRVQYRPSYQSWERVLVLVTSMMVLRIFGRFFIFERVLFLFLFAPPLVVLGVETFKNVVLGSPQAENFGVF